MAKSLHWELSNSKKTEFRIAQRSVVVPAVEEVKSVEWRRRKNINNTLTSENGDTSTSHQSSPLFGRK